MSRARAPGGRGIRSYVLRQGRTTPSQQRALDDLFPRYGISLSESFLDTGRIFERTAPVVLEIGSGMGETTAQIAAEPETAAVGRVRTTAVVVAAAEVQALTVTVTL